MLMHSLQPCGGLPIRRHRSRWLSLHCRVVCALCGLLILSIGSVRAEEDTDYKTSRALTALKELRIAAADDASSTDALKPLVEAAFAAIRDAGTPLASGDTATFVFFGPAASVASRGAYDAGTGEATTTLSRLGKLDVWTGEAKLPHDAEFLYTFAVDGKTQPDPLCKETLEGFGTNSVGRMPGCAPLAETRHRSEVPHGKLESFEFKSKARRDVRQISVYLPPGYERSEERYPVVYVQDGDVSLSDGRFDRIVDNLLADRAITPLILCFVPPDNRAVEYWISEKEYAAFLTEELVPAIDKRYRTLAAPEHRAVAGSSLGGRISTYLVLNHPDVFSICIGQSSYFEKGCKIPARLKAAERLPVRFYYDVGQFERAVAKAFGAEFTRDLLRVNRDLRDMLKDRGYAVTYREWPGDHCMLTWSRGMVEALKTFWPATEKGE